MKPFSTGREICFPLQKTKLTKSAQELVPIGGKIDALQSAVGAM